MGASVISAPFPQSSFRKNQRRVADMELQVQENLVYLFLFKLKPLKTPDWKNLLAVNVSIFNLLLIRNNSVKKINQKSSPSSGLKSMHNVAIGIVRPKRDRFTQTFGKCFKMRRTARTTAWCTSVLNLENTCLFFPSVAESLTFLLSLF